MMQSLLTSFEKMQGSTNALCDMNKVLSVISLGFNKSLQNLIQTLKFDASHIKSFQHDQIFLFIWVVKKCTWNNDLSSYSRFQTKYKSFNTPQHIFNILLATIWDTRILITMDKDSLVFHQIVSEYVLVDLRAIIDVNQIFKCATDINIICRTLFPPWPLCWSSINCVDISN